jgi:hypothetical protein
VISVSIDPKWRVRAVSVTELPLSAGIVWGQMRDLLSFICIDPLHARAWTHDGVRARLGSELTIEHRLLGVGPDRRSRVLRWREGRGYVVSDLSTRGNHAGFPHVCVYDLSSTGPGRSQLTIEARGVWTARWVPRPLVKAWLWWVLASTEACQARALLTLKVHQKHSRPGFGLGGGS